MTATSGTRITNALVELLVVRCNCAAGLGPGEVAARTGTVAIGVADAGFVVLARAVRALLRCFVARCGRASAGCAVETDPRRS